jgi:hypothetical protein
VSIGQAEWLTAAAIFAAMNTNKELRKMGRRTPPSMPQSYLLVNGGLMAISRTAPLTGR